MTILSECRELTSSTMLLNVEHRILTMLDFKELSPLKVKNIVYVNSVRICFALLFGLISVMR